MCAFQSNNVFCSVFSSKALADYSKDFVVSVVLGKDLVPR